MERQLDLLTPAYTRWVMRDFAAKSGREVGSTMNRLALCEQLQASEHSHKHPAELVPGYSGRAVCATLACANGQNHSPIGRFKVVTASKMAASWVAASGLEEVYGRHRSLLPPSSGRHHPGDGGNKHL